MKPVVLGTAFGSRLNLNGDQGNLLALRRYLSAAGFEVEIRSAATTEAALSCDFWFVGHGSVAAMQSIDEALRAIDWTRVLAEVPGLVVGSSFEWLAAHGKLNDTIQRGERVSQFEVAEFGPLRVLGYRNTDSGLPNLSLSGRVICTMLHGPLLAKNPQLLDRAARAAVTKAGLDWPLAAPAELGAWIDSLNKVCGEIWSLETDEEFPELKR